jgi:hypothetical protein
VHASGLVESAQVLGDRPAHSTGRREVGGVDEGRVVPVAHRVRGDLGADQPAPDDHHTPRPRLEAGPERLGILERAHHERAPDILDELDVTWPGAGRDHQAVEAERRPVAQDHPLPAEVEPRGGLPEPPDHIGRRVLDLETGTVDQPGEVRLGEWEAVVGAMLLAPDHDQVPVVPEGTESPCHPVAGEGAADDHHPSHDERRPGAPGLSRRSTEERRP